MDQDLRGMDELPPLALCPGDAPARKLSAILADLAANATRPVSVGEIRDAIGDRSFAALLVLFAALNLLPLPPGSTLFFGIPLMLVSAQMVLGYRQAWLPQALLRRTVGADRFRRAAGTLVPRLQRLEEIVRPRRWPFSEATADRVIGLITLVLGIAVFLPIPLGNWLPAFAVAVIGIAFSERDGVVLAAGIGIGVLSLAIIGVVVGAAGIAANMVFGI